MNEDDYDNLINAITFLCHVFILLDLRIFRNTRVLAKMIFLFRFDYNKYLEYSSFFERERKKTRFSSKHWKFFDILGLIGK